MDQSLLIMINSYSLLNKLRNRNKEFKEFNMLNKDNSKSKESMESKMLNYNLDLMSNLH
jgi:hypothetical protein